MSMMYVRNLVDLHLKYYADNHEVDEDTAVIADYGGQWMNVTGAGIFNRGLDDNPSAMWGDVAYKFNKNSTPVMRVEF